MHGQQQRTRDARPGLAARRQRCAALREASWDVSGARTALLMRVLVASDLRLAGTSGEETAALLIIPVVGSAACPSRRARGLRLVLAPSSSSSSATAAVTFPSVRACPSETKPVSGTCAAGRGGMAVGTHMAQASAATQRAVGA